MLVKNAKIFTSAGKVYEKGDILIKDGIIAAVGESLSVEGHETIDAAGLTALPGIIDAHSHIGTSELREGTYNFNEGTNSATPELDIRYSINYNSTLFQRYLKAGITTSCILPGSANVIGGLGCVVKSWGKKENRLISHSMAMKMALGLNPKNFHGKERKEAPMTRMGIAKIIIDHLNRAKQYMERRALPEDHPKHPQFDQGLENLAMVLRREIPLKVHSEQFDMLLVFQIAEMFDIDFCIEHGWGASDFYEDFVNEKRLKGVLYGPMAYMPRYPGEIGKQDPYSLIHLDKNGVNCVLITDGPSFDPEIMFLQAGEVIRFGGEIDRVINMMTINAAKALGVDNRTGSIEVDKDADIILYKGIPGLDTAATAIYGMVDGEIVFSPAIRL